MQDSTSSYKHSYGCLNQSIVYVGYGGCFNISRAVTLMLSLELLRFFTRSSENFNLTTFLVRWNYQMVLGDTCAVKSPSISGEFRQQIPTSSYVD